VPADGQRPGASSASTRELLERLALAGIGAVALTAERVDELASDLAERGGIQRDEARQAIEDATSRWRGDATRLTERAGAGLQSFFDQLGLVSRDAYEELELRVAQLEHRLRLAEGRIESSAAKALEPGTGTQSARSRSPRVQG
jgi:polyhydroxyalkanoate synthesis regulator phasin